MKTNVSLMSTLVTLAACASSPPPLPYAAFIAIDELPDTFLAGLPGVQAKQLAADPRTRRSSHRVILPSDWNFTTGASPGQSVELLVLAGEMQLGDFKLTEGGYAYIPPASSGMRMQSDDGAVLLYFLDDADAAAVIQTPLITNTELLQWDPGAIGYSSKELRKDPGSGARTWLLSVSPEAAPQWQRSIQPVEGYLMSGTMTYSECNGGESVTADYLPGGYFYRPPGSIHGGSEAKTTTGAVWLMRTRGEDETAVVACEAAGSDDQLPD